MNSTRSVGIYLYGYIVGMLEQAAREKKKKILDESDWISYASHPQSGAERAIRLAVENKVMADDLHRRVEALSSHIADQKQGTAECSGNEIGMWYIGYYCGWQDASHEPSDC